MSSRTARWCVEVSITRNKKTYWYFTTKVDAQKYIVMNIHNWTFIRIDIQKLS